MLFTRDVPGLRLAGTAPDDAASLAGAGVRRFGDRGIRARGERPARGEQAVYTDGGGGMDERFGAEQGLVKA
ncbi:hypothetical protein Asp14428_25230 [Actinoplanes sp. NBRC 14428]|nr:hypothetical protein Asp14428_25230 [Actinoplanes sp. NBRC 14428]